MKYDAYGTAEAVPFQIKCNTKSKIKCNTKPKVKYNTDFFRNLPS